MSNINKLEQVQRDIFDIEEKYEPNRFIRLSLYKARIEISNAIKFIALQEREKGKKNDR